MCRVVMGREGIGTGKRGHDVDVGRRNLFMVTATPKGNSFAKVGKAYVTALSRVLFGGVNQGGEEVHAMRCSLSQDKEQTD